MGEQTPQMSPEEIEKQRKEMEKNCIFCKIVRKEVPKEFIFENDKYLAFLDINPTNPGHTLVIPKKHYINALDTPDDVMAGLIGVGKLVAINQIQHLKAEGFNLWINNFPAAGQVIFHTHLHVVPRFPGDGIRILKVKQEEKGSKEDSRSLEEKA